MTPLITAAEVCVVIRLVRTLSLSPEEQAELERTVRSHPKAYVRERAAGVLKVAKGQIAYRVAKRGLLRPRDPDTVYAWLNRYEAAGIEGLLDKPGRGRKPAFSPSLRGA